MSKLLNCPFCGGEAERVGSSAFCKDLTCAGSGIEATVKQWNTRTKSEAEELLEFQYALLITVAPIVANDWNATRPGISVYGKTPLDALRAAREAMEDEN